MPVNIGPRIGIEGEDEYRKQITNLVQSTKTLDAQMKALEATSDKETTAQEKAAKATELLSKKQDEQKKRVETLKKMVEESAKATGDSSTQTLKWKEALANAEAELGKTGKELEAAQKAADGYGNEAEEAAEQTTKIDEAAKLLAAEKLADFFSKVGDAAKKMAGAAYDAAKELDAGYDTIIKKTGASGDQLAELQSVADDVFRSMPVEMADVGTAVGELNTRFGLTGDELTSASKTFLQFAKITDTDVNTAIGTTSKVLKAYGGDVKDTDKLLGYLAKQSQQTGVDTGSLMSSLEQNGAVLREMGIGLQESVKLLASFEENGVDASAAMTGLRKAITNGAKEGKNANEVLSDTISGIKNAKSDTEALQIATEVFGTRGAAVMADGIRSGRIALDDLSESMDQYGTVVSDTFEATLDPWDQAKTAMNALKTAGSDLAGEALATLAPAIEKVVGWIQQATDWFRGLPDPVKKVTAVIGLLGAGAAVVGPKLLSMVNTIKSLQASTSILKGFSSAADSASSAGSKLGGSFGQTAGIVTAVAAAIAALNTAMVEASLASNEWYQAAVKDADAMKALKGEAEALGREIEDNRAKEEAEAKQISDLADELTDLNKKSKLTTDEQKRYKQIVQQLNGLLPDFSGEIDESTGKLIDQSKASKEAIDELADNKRALNASDNLTAALDRQSEALAKQTEAEQTAKEWAERLGVSIDELKTKTDGAEVSQSGFAGTLAKLAGNTTFTFMDKVAEAVVNTGDAMRAADTAVEETSAEVDKYSDAAGDAADASEDLGDAAQSMGDDVSVASDDVESAFDDILNAAKDDLAKSITYLDQWASDGGADLTSMAKQMQKNAQDMAAWRTNVILITSDARYGMDRNYTAAVDMLIAQGGRGATAVAQFADAMRTGNNQAVNAFLTGYNGISTQATQIENRIGTLQANAKAKLDGLKPAAEQGVAGMAEGMKASKALVDQVARQIADAQELAKVSTSTAKSWGADAVAALAKGMESESWQVRKQANILAQDVKDRLGHSTPKLGPLHGDDKWGYHLADNIAEGIAANSSLNKIQNAATQAAFAAMPTMQLPSGTTTNNSLTYGDIVVNVSGANVQNDQALAKMVSDQIFRRVQAQKAVWS